jgi:hypothetical protein
MAAEDSSMFVSSLSEYLTEEEHDIRKNTGRIKKAGSKKESLRLCK